MRSIIITLLLLAAGGSICKAQCDKKLTLTSSHTQHLDANNNVEKTVDEDAVFQISGKDIKILINGNNEMSGTINSVNCNWTVPFKEGKSVIDTHLEDQSGDPKDATITIEGKDGKITLLAVLKNMPDHKLRLAIDKFEEITETTTK
jgi:hypothetical protein